MSTTAETGRDVALQRLEDGIASLIRHVRPLLWERTRALHPDLQVASYLLLAHLVRHGPLRASEIVAALGIDKGAISRQLQHLVELGLVVRSPDPMDGRASLLRVTDEARERMGVVAAEGRTALSGRLADWDEADIEALAGLLARYDETLARRA